MMRIKTIIAAAAIAVTSTAVSADMKPAVIYDMGGKFDKSFNEGVYNGVKKFTDCLLYTSPSPRDLARSRMPSSA